MTAEIIEKKNGSRRQADDMRNIALDRPSVVFLKLAPEKVARYERRGDDLVLVLKDGQEITIAGFFVKYADEASTGQTPAADTPAEAAHDRSELVLVDDNDVSWWGQYPDQWSEFHFAEIEWDDVAGFAWWPLALGALGAAAAGVAALSFGGGGKASHPPVAADDSVTGREDGGPVTGNVLNNDTDGDRLAVTRFTIGGQSYNAGDTAIIAGVGTLKMDGNGGYSFTPDANWNGTVPTVTYTVSDGKGGTDTANLVITITAVTDLVADDDSVTAVEDTPVTGSVAGNDSTTSGGTLVFAKASDPAHGSVIVNGDGSYTYTPDANYNGPDSFTYTVTDPASGESSTQTVTVTVTPVTDLTAADDAVTTAEDTPVTGSVAGNDSTTSGGSLSFAKASDPAHGSVVVNSDGTYTYTPDANYNGTDSFTYTVTDPASGESSTQTVTVSVTPVTDLTAADDAITTDEDTPVTGSVAGNDSTTSGGTLVFAKGSDPAHGSVIINSDGTYTYTPNANYNGPDSFTYTITDPASGESSTRTVTVSVSPVTDLTAADDAITTDEDTPVTGSVAGNDSTTSGGTLVFAKASDPAHGSVVVNSDGTYTYTPDANYNGPDSFTYTVTDPASGESLTRTVNITVTPVTDLTAADDSVTTDEDTPVTGSVAANDSTTSGGALVFTKAGDPAHGSVVVNSDGTYTYTPDANYNGTDSFTYTVTDPASGESSTQTVTVTVTPVTDLTAADDAVTTAEDTPVTGSVAGNDSTTSGGTLSFAKASDPAHGSVVVNSNGTYTYTPNANYNGPDSFTYTITDPASGESSTRTVTVSVSPVTDLTAADDAITTDEDTPVTGSVAGNDSTTSGGTLVFAKASDPAHGSVVVNSDGSYTYTPDANYNGTDSFTYTVTDPASGESLTRTVTVSVTPVTDLTAADDSVTTAEDTPVTSSVAANDSTTSGGTLVFTKASDPAHGSVIVNNDGTYTYTPDANYNGPDSFTYTVTDPASGESLTRTVTVSVSPVTDLIAADDSITTAEDTPVTSSVAGNDSTTSGGTLVFAKASDPAHGSVTVNGNGTYTYTPDANYNGPDSFTYTVTDPASGESLTRTVTVSVTPVTDLTAVNDSVTTAEDTPVTSSVAGNDSTTSGGTLVFAKASDPAHGSVTVNGNGTYTYTPGADYNGPDSFTYTVTDAASGESLTRTVNITIDPVNDAPVASGTIADRNNDDFDAVTSFDVKGFFNDVDGDALTYSASGLPKGLTINAVTGVISGTIDHSASQDQPGGVHSVTITASDGEASATQSFTWTVSNPSPVAADDSVTINEDTSVHANVLTNDSDPDGDTLSVTDFTINGVTHPTGSDSVIIAGVGSFRMDSGGNYSFTPVLDWNGTVPTIGYTVADSDGATDTAELKISVTPVNDAPVIQGGHQSGAVVEAGNLDDGTVVAGTVSASGQFTATDVDSGTLTWSRIGAADTSYGTFNINSATGAWTYALNNALPATQALKENETKTLTYQVQVSDGAGGTATRDVVITITGTNDSPVAVADIGSVVEAGVQNGGNTATAGTGTAAANVLTNDSDVDAGEKATLQVSAVSFGGTPGTVGSVLSATYGTFVLNANGSYTYTLQNDWAATQALKQGDTVTEIFSYTAVDVNGATSQSTLTITVTGTNDRPVITSAPSAATGEVTEQGTGNPAEPNTATGTLTAVDPDSGATLTWNVIGSNNGTYGTISINPATGAWIYSLDNGRLATQALNNNDTKVDKFTVRVTDEHGASREQEIAVTVHGSNDNLTGTLPGTPIAVTEDVEKTGTLQTYISDVDDNAATIKVTGFQVDANGDGTNESYAPGAAVTLTDAAGNAIGTLIIAENGDYSFNPHANYSGNVPPVTFTMADSGGATVTQTLTFAIKPVSDAPVLTPVADITTNEDTAVALGLHAPAIADTGTLSPGASNDYSERLGTITLTIGGAGANGVTLSTGATVLTPVNDLVHIILTDVPHVLDAPPANPANGVYHMTAAQYEALMANPAPESGKNFTVAVTARSFEVDGTGAIRPTVPGATSTQTVNVDVRAVTDGATLTSDRTSVTFPEDASLYLTGLLTAALADSDGHPGDDTDGSETYWYSIGGLPVGTVITIDGTATEITSAGMVVSSPVSPSATPPAINIKPPLNFSGDMKGVTVTLNSQDTDSDSSHTPAVITSPVTLDLYVSPVAGDISVGSGIVSTNEDTAVAFLKDVTVTDTSAGNEIITSVSFTVPSGWTVTPPTSSPGWSYGLSGTLTQIIFASNPALTEAQREAVLDGFLIKPPANSSKDVDITLTIRTSDTNMVNGSTVTATSALNRTVKIVVDPVAERTDGDSNANGTPDAAMIGSHVYSVAGEEDAWFALGTTYTGAANTGGGADLLTGWSNEDADEFTYAVLTPTLGGAAPGDSIIGAQFRFSTDGGATWQTRTYAGDAVWVPRQYLDTLQVKLPPDVTGTLTVQVQAGTVDYDDDAEQLVLPLDPPHVSGAGVNVQVSGSATLSTIQFTPVADPVTMALNGRAVGKEDTAIPLAIKVTSSDSSESFNVTLSQIPTGAKVIYGGTEQTVVGGAVTIANFDNSVPMTITPPPDSNQNFALKVSAVSVDGSDTSAPVERSINVSVSGVADTAIVTPMMDPAISEAYVDASGHKVALSAMLASVTSPDVDGSEAVTLRISGLAPDFSIAGATVVVAGSGTERVWMVPANKLADVSIVLPANYSGKVELEVAGVTTENDGDSLTGAPVPLSLTVTPSPEATINDSAMLVEDEVTALNLSIIHRNGDTDEALGHIYIVADYAAGAQYALYLGGTALESAGVGPTTLTDVPGLPNGDYYVLTASQIGQLGAKGAPHLDGGLGSLPLFYEIIDPSGDTTPATSEILLGSVALTAMPITDAVDATITAITVNAGVGSTADIVPGGDAVPDTATMNSSGALTVRLHVDSADSDGSEHLIRVLIGGVPDGVTVTGAAQLGGGQWLLVYDGAAAKSIGAGGIDLPVEFVVGKGTANGGSNITMTVLAQDEGQSATPAATIETDTVGWRLEVALTDGQPLPPPSVTLVYNGAEGVEDIAFALGDMLDATAVIPNASLAYNYTITVTGLPEGTVVDGMVLTSIGGAPVWTAAVTVPANGDSQAAIDALLDSIHITAPANSNDNHGPFHFDARLTGSAVGGVSVSDSTDATVPIAPQTDAASVTVTTSNVGEGETSVTATITAQDVIDGSFGRIVGDTLYVRVTTAGNPGGTVTDGAGNILSPTSVSGVDGVADGDYFVITLPASGDGVQLTYTADGTLNPGDVVFTAWARTQEDNAANIVTGSGTATARVLVVNNGVTVTSSDVTASEPSSSNPQDAIQLTGLSVALNDDDGSEAIHSILLSGLPVGFLLYVGSSAGSAEAAAPASNAGGDGNTNTWVLSATGELPAYVAILPPSYWSGTLEHLKLVVESGESSLTPLVQVIDLGVLTVEAVANGLTIDPSLSFGIEGHIIDINLNAAMVNAGTATASLPDSSTETTTLQISGLGQYAAFYIGNTLLTSVSYDEGGDVYTITGLRQSALDQLGFVQAASATPAQVSVTAWTVETDNGHESAKVTGTLTLDVAPVLATTGNDHFIWDGVTAINGRAGEDTVALRHGEDVTHGDLAARLSNVEVIDLSSPGANSIAGTGGLTIDDVLKITGASDGKLTIDGDGEDSVLLSNEWSTTGPATDGHLLYTNTTSGITLSIDEDIHVSYAA